MYVLSFLICKSFGHVLCTTSTSLADQIAELTLQAVHHKIYTAPAREGAVARDIQRIEDMHAIIQVSHLLAIELGHTKHCHKIVQLHTLEEVATLEPCIPSSVWWGDLGSWTVDVLLCIVVFTYLTTTSTLSAFSFERCAYGYILVPSNGRS